MAKSRTSGAGGDIATKIKSVESKMSETAKYATPAFYDKVKAQEYYRLRSELTDLRKQSDNMLTKKLQTASSTQKPRKQTFVNSFGEATKREITTSSFKSSQRKLGKQISRFIGG